jgi:ribosomal protein S18 acetylase RimI-like enzyme
MEEAAISIREMDLGDAEFVAEIERSITKSEHKVDLVKAVQEFIKKRDGISYVATVGDKVVGYMICYILSAGFGIERSAWIASLGVDPRYMGQGIGKRLAQMVLDRCREKGIKNVFTSVRWDSVDLLSFFKTLGFDRSEFINLKRSL